MQKQFTVIKDTFTDEYGLVRQKGLIEFFTSKGKKPYDFAMWVEPAHNRYIVVKTVKSLKEFISFLKENNA